MPPCVLVVDDEFDIRQAMAEVLGDAGYTVHTAPHGADALAHMRSCPPRIVVLDLVMPIRDGWSVVDDMLRDPALAEIPVCIVSAVADKAPPPGKRVLSKPLRLDALLAVIEAAAVDAK